MRKALPVFIEALIHFGDIQRPILKWAFDAGVAFPFVKYSGFVAKTLPREIFERIARAYAELDFKVYYKTMKFMGEHDACDVMESVNMPSLIIYGGRDTFTPMERAEEMKARIKGSELFYLEDGSHYVMIEYPKLVHERMEKFFKDNGLG
jgi:pimeloyl-ACP methyl ester carboxylesterase